MTTTSAWLAGLLAVAACGFPEPAFIEPGMGSEDPGDTACQLTAIRPSIANTGDTIILEGVFDSAVMVTFPGGETIPATVLGPRRATVQVPASATAGELTVASCSATLGSSPFRRASFSLGVSSFARDYDQSSYARQFPSLATDRDSHTAVTIGHHLYILGGAGRTGTLNSIERALINADGTIGQFSLAPDIALVVPRQAHTTTIVREHVYVIGGFGNGALSSIEHATIAEDGSLGPFTILANVSLTTARQGHTTIVIGNYVYVIGGLGTTSLNSVERAAIRTDGSLGAFSTVPGVSLGTARRRHAAAVIGKHLYVIGGAGNNGALKDVERGTVNPDGSLDSFMMIPGTGLTTPRSGHTIVQLGNQLHVLGGRSDSGVLRIGERATINNDGSLTSFESTPEATSAGLRHGHTTTIAGNYMYNFGGSNDMSFVSPGEYASLNKSAELGPFAVNSDAKLSIEREQGAGVVLGNYMYAIGGGIGPSGSEARTIERAVINPDGSIGSFAVVPDSTLARGRNPSTAAVIGRYVYIFGSDKAISRSGKEVQRAAIGLDGTLGSFEVVSSLVNDRNRVAVFVHDRRVYALGSTTNDSSTIEYAAIHTDGSLGEFQIHSQDATAANAELRTPLIGGYAYILHGDIQAGGAHRWRPSGGTSSFEPVPALGLNALVPTTMVAGGYFYAIGDSLVQRATISGEQRELGMFAAVPGGRLTGPRLYASSAMLGNYFYLFGGVSGRRALNTTERAELR